MAHLRIASPDPSEHAPYYGRYVGLVPGDDIIQTLTEQVGETLAFLGSRTGPAADHRYAPGKWSVKEVVGHLIDAERVFAHRALWFSRRDPAPLPGFEQDDWVNAATFGEQSLDDLAAEFESVRRANLHFFRHLSEEAWQRRGVANNAEISVRAIAYVIAGHERYHLEILRTRY